MKHFLNQDVYKRQPTYNRIKGTKSLGRVYTFEPVSNELAEDERKYITTFITQHDRILTDRGKKHELMGKASTHHTGI